MVLPVMGTAHPTGYPTYVLIGWLASIVLQPFGEGRGAVEGEDGAAPRLGVEMAGEAGLDAGRFVGEGEGCARSGNAFL